MIVAEIFPLHDATGIKIYLLLFLQRGDVTHCCILQRGVIQGDVTDRCILQQGVKKKLGEFKYMILIGLG
jgi:hypothetical protein